MPLVGGAWFNSVYPDMVRAPLARVSARSQIYQTFQVLRGFPALILTRALGTAYPAGTAVTLVTVPFTGTAVEDGNPRDSLGVMQLKHFPGHYTYSPGIDEPSRISTQLTTNIPPADQIAYDTGSGFLCLEVYFMSLLWAAPAKARVGKGSGFQEDVNIQAITRKADITTATVSGTNSAGSNTLNVAGANLFPVSTSPSISLGFHVLINAGGGTKETVRVLQNTHTATGTFTLETPLVSTHNNGETVALVADVATLTTPITQPRKGAFGTKTPHIIQPLLSQINISNGAQFPSNGGTAWLNFGKPQLDLEVPIVSFTAPRTYGFLGPFLPQGTIAFPDTTFSTFEMMLGDGLTTRELVLVLTNDVILNKLTLTTAYPASSHSVGEKVKFLAGTPEAVKYSSRSGNTLILEEEQTFLSRHNAYEQVVYSPDESLPATDGSTYQFFLPPDPGACFKKLFELVRSAGIKVTVITDK